MLLAAGCGRSRVPAETHAVTASPGLQLAPPSPNINSELRAVVDLRGTDPARCGYTWTRNGTIIPGETGTTLAPRWLHKGDEITVTVRLPAGAGAANSTLTAGVRIGDAAPRVADVYVKLMTYTNGYTFASMAHCVDPDGDPLTVSRQWYRNDQAIPGATDSLLVLPSLAAGDRIAVEVAATDGEASSTPHRSDALVLTDQPPAFTSQPPAVATRDSVYRYQAAARDPDGDPLRFELVEAPPGADLSPDGLLSWRLPPPASRAGNFRIVIRVTDARGGTATQTLELHPPPSPASASGT